MFVSASALLVFFFVWGLALLVFRLLAPSNGSNATRWLAGQPLRMESPPVASRHYDSRTAETASMKEWKQEYKSAKRQLLKYRIIVWAAGLSISIAALVMSVYGIDSLANTLEAGRESIGIIRSLAGKAQVIVDAVISQNRDLSRKVFGMLEEVNGICPMVRDPLCDDIYNTTTCDLASVLGNDLNEVFQTAAGHFAAGDESEYFLEIVNAKNGLKDVEMASRNMDNSAAHLNWVLALSMILSLLLAMLCILILCGMICPEVPKVLQMIRSRFMIPTFSVLVFFAYVFCLVFVTASIATADLCVYHDETSNIDVRLMNLLNRSEAVEELLGDDQEVRNLVTEFIGFYINQCPVEMLPTEVLDQLEYVRAGVPLVQEFGSIVANSTDAIQGICGFESDQTENLVDVANTLQDQLCGLAEIVADVRDFVQCGNWYPLYETTVYEALCYDGTKGFAYVAWTQFVIVFMSFVVLTFRVAFQNVRVGDEFFDFVDDDSYSSYSGSHDDYDYENANSGGNDYYGDIRHKLGLRDTLMESSSSRSSSYSWGSGSYSGSSASRERRYNNNTRYQPRAAAPVSLEAKMNELRKSERDWHRIAAQLSPDRTASLSSGSSSGGDGEEYPPPRRQPHARNSIYPSRRLLCRGRGGGHDDDNSPGPAPIVAAVGSTTAYDSGENGIEVVHDFGINNKTNGDDAGHHPHTGGGGGGGSNDRHGGGGNGNNNNGIAAQKSSGRGFGRKRSFPGNNNKAIAVQKSSSRSFDSKRSFPGGGGGGGGGDKSRFVDSSSLWLKHHRDNIEYIDSEDDDDDSCYSYDSYGDDNDWSSRGG